VRSRLYYLYPYRTCIGVGIGSISPRSLSELMCTLGTATYSRYI
jgi:hypothetical protein